MQAATGTGALEDRGGSDSRPGGEEQWRRCTVIQTNVLVLVVLVTLRCEGGSQSGYWPGPL